MEPNFQFGGELVEFCKGIGNVRLAGGSDVYAKMSAELEDVRLRGIELQKRLATASGLPYDRILIEFSDNSTSVWDKG